MSKKSKRRKNVDMRENNMPDEAGLSSKAEGTATGNADTNGGNGSFRPVLTGILVASILAVATISLIDVNNVYGEYCREHDGVPAVLACVDAISEGIFPWTQITAYAAENDGYADGGPGVVQASEDLLNVAEPEMQPETVAETAEDPQPVKKAEPAGAADSKAEISPETESKEGGPATVSSTDDGKTKTFTKVDMSYFGNAAFVGDSFTQGLMLYADIPGADCLCYQSKTTKNIMDSEIHLKSGKTSTVRNELSKKQYGKVYIMLGINELSKDAGKFAERYQKVISEIRALQPNATIYVQSIFHTTPNKSANSNFKNDIIDLNNQALAGLADNKTVFFVDVNPPFDDGTGALRADYSGDGVHLKAARYKDWRDYLLNFGVVK